MPIDSVEELSIPAPLDRRNDPPPSQELDRESFMKLLVAELKNQDPLEPLQAREMVTQLSQLTSVEKLINIEQGIAAVQAETAGVASTQLSSLVGRQVTADVSAVDLGQTGGVTSQFNVQSRAAEVEVTIREPTGEVIRVVKLGDTFPGLRSFSWDGNNESGERMPPGRYGVEVSGRDADGLQVVTSTEVSGIVSAVSYDTGLPQLVMGNTKVMLGDVTSIAQ
ncbi:MAG: hypothetical protein OXU20_18275 [Myxococcales bacterium]|nr:hypothetical protein [Myxococcales bacterium]MDD9968318.1 hypothetical protein [Myxococcales bacterium]